MDKLNAIDNKVDDLTNRFNALSQNLPPPFASMEDANVSILFYHY